MKISEDEKMIDYKRAFKIACELLNGTILYGVDKDSIFETIMNEDGIVDNESYENYILSHMDELDRGNGITREEAIKIFKDKIKTMEDGAICCNFGIDKDAFILAIQALKQEDVVTISEIPKDYIYDTDTRDFLVYRNKYTGDEMHIKRPVSLYILDQDLCSACVNREAVHRQINEWLTMSCKTLLDLHKRIDTLPIITSKPKEGHWIKEKSLHGWDGKSYQCSVCGRSIHIDPETEDLSDYPYCHCGAIMTEEEKKE